MSNVFQTNWFFQLAHFEIVNPLFKKRPALKELLILKQNKAHCKNTYMVHQSVFISLHQFYVCGLIPQMEGTRNQI